MNTIYQRITDWISKNKFLFWLVIITVGSIIFLPKLIKLLFGKKRTVRHHRSYKPQYSFARRGRSVGRGKGSLYMKRKMARLRSMRRRKLRRVA